MYHFNATAGRWRVGLRCGAAGCYTYGMTIDGLKASLSRRPFKPFRVITSSGERYDVRHPENAFLYKSGMIVAHGGGNGDLPESYADLALLHITAVEKIARGRSPGVHRRKRR